MMKYPMLMIWIRIWIMMCNSLTKLFANPMMKRFCWFFYWFCSCFCWFCCWFCLFFFPSKLLMNTIIYLQLLVDNDADEFSSVLKHECTPKILITSFRFNFTVCPLFHFFIFNIVVVSNWDSSFTKILFYCF